MQSYMYAVSTGEFQALSESEELAWRGKSAVLEFAGSFEFS